MRLHAIAGKLGTSSQWQLGRQPLGAFDHAGFMEASCQYRAAGAGRRGEHYVTLAFFEDASFEMPTSMNPDVTSSRACRAVSVAAGVYAIAGGIVSLTGWALNLPRLTHWINDGIAMFPNAAICAVVGGLALVGLALGLESRAGIFVVRALAMCMALVGVLTLLEHIADVNLGIDTLIFNKPWGQRASTAPMRMGPPASASFTLLGWAIWLATSSSQWRRFGSALALLVMSITLLSLTGYSFGADQLFGIARLTGIAFQTSTILAALSVGLMTSIPEHGFVAVLRRDDAGGAVLRRLTVAIIVVPLVLGWLRLVGQQAGFYDLAFGTAVRTVVEIILLFGLLWWTANGISKQSQGRRAAEQAARQADRRKDEFLATLAHELRNPLAAIGNAMQLLRHADHDPAVTRQAQDTLQRQFSKMVRLVDDLLDIGRITRDKLELRKARTELKPVILQAIETTRALPEGAGHDLQVALPTEPIWLDADPVRLSQVFSNLLTNACKFSDAGGTVSITAARQGDVAVVTVKDSGIGIEPDKRESIFQMFEQVDQSLERTHSGLGIGLTLVKRLVELHGGSIAAHSEGLGRGSQFVVRLPLLVEQPSPTTAPCGACAAPSASKRILVTDDNRDAANSLAMLLKISGHQVDTAYDGAEAIRKAEANHPDVILLDLGMPGKNGYEVCRSIRQVPWGKDIRIVALTGWGQEQDRRKTRDAGFDHHLVKPVSPDALKEALAPRRDVQS